MLTSVAERIVRTARCPVLTVPLAMHDFIEVLGTADPARVLAPGAEGRKGPCSSGF